MNDEVFATSKKYVLKSLDSCWTETWPLCVLCLLLVWISLSLSPVFCSLDGSFHPSLILLNISLQACRWKEPDV